MLKFGFIMRVVSILDGSFLKKRVLLQIPLKICPGSSEKRLFQRSYPSSTENENISLTENGAELLRENGKILFTENGTTLVTENGDIFFMEIEVILMRENTDILFTGNGAPLY